MQLIQDLINNKSSRICSRSPSGFVLEVTPDPSGRQVVAASPAVDKNLCQYFVITELPGQGFYTIANTAATGTFLEPSADSAPPGLTASSRRFADENQEWKLTFEENVNGWDYYSIESVRYPGNVLVLDKTSVKLNIRGQSSQPAVYQHWTIVPAGEPSDPFLNDNQDIVNNDLVELRDLKEKVAELMEEIAEKDLLIKDKDEEINRLRELIEALSAPTAPAVGPVPEADAGQASTAIVLYDFEATEDFEMSLVEGEYIKHIEQCDDGWWSGVGRGGKTGLFPSPFVRLLEGSEPPPPPPEIPATRVGDKAVALYDYHGAEDNQVTFREGDIITDLVSERWLRGKSPSGEVGLFPSIYVNLESQSQQSSSSTSGRS